MFPVATSQIEEMKQTEYLKTKIREAFNIIDYQNTGRIPETYLYISQLIIGKSVMLCDI